MNTKNWSCTHGKTTNKRVVESSIDGKVVEREVKCPVIENVGYSNLVSPICYNQPVTGTSIQSRLEERSSLPSPRNAGAV